MDDGVGTLVVEIIKLRGPLEDWRANLRKKRPGDGVRNSARGHPLPL